MNELIQIVRCHVSLPGGRQCSPCPIFSLIYNWVKFSAESITRLGKNLQSKKCPKNFHIFYVKELMEHQLGLVELILSSYSREIMLILFSGKYY